MRIVKTKVYKFDELADESKQNAIDHNADISVGYEWWESDYEYMAEKLEEVGIYCTDFYFSLDRTSYLTMNNESVSDTNKLLKFAGYDLRTKEAKELIDSCCIEPLEDDKVKMAVNSLLADLWDMLKRSYKYYTSEEAIKETLIANEYDFKDDGTLF